MESPWNEIIYTSGSIDNKMEWWLQVIMHHYVMHGNKTQNLPRNRSLVQKSLNGNGEFAKESTDGWTAFGKFILHFKLQHVGG